MAHNATWQEGFGDAVAGKRLDNPRDRPAWWTAERHRRTEYLDGYHAGSAYLLGCLHGEEDTAAMTWPQLHHDIYPRRKGSLRFDVEPHRDEYMAHYAHGIAYGTAARDKGRLEGEDR